MTDDLATRIVEALHPKRLWSISNDERADIIRHLLPPASVNAELAREIVDIDLEILRRRRKRSLGHVGGVTYREDEPLMKRRTELLDAYMKGKANEIAIQSKRDSATPVDESQDKPDSNSDRPTTTALNSVRSTADSVDRGDAAATKVHEENGWCQCQFPTVTTGLGTHCDYCLKPIPRKQSKPTSLASPSASDIADQTNPINARLTTMVSLLKRAANAPGLLLEGRDSSTHYNDAVMKVVEAFGEIVGEVAPDEHWWREVFLLTGEHMILCEEGWGPGSSLTEYRKDDPNFEPLDEVNAPPSPAPSDRDVSDNDGVVHEASDHPTSPCVICDKPVCIEEGCKRLGHGTGCQLSHDKGWVCSERCWEKVAAITEGFEFPPSAPSATTGDAASGAGEDRISKIASGQITFESPSSARFTIQEIANLLLTERRKFEAKVAELEGRVKELKQKLEYANADAEVAKMREDDARLNVDTLREGKDLDDDDLWAQMRRERDDATARAEAAERERDRLKVKYEEASAEVAACLDFLWTEQHWECFRVEMLDHKKDEQKKENCSEENARLISNYLKDKGHGIALLKRLKAAESAAERERDGLRKKIRAVLNEPDEDKYQYPLAFQKINAIRAILDPTPVAPVTDEGELPSDAEVGK